MTVFCEENSEVALTIDETWSVVKIDMMTSSRGGYATSDGVKVTM